MTQYMQFPTEDGGTILVEVDVEEEKTEGLVKAGRAEKVKATIVKVRDSFESTMMETVRRNAEAFIKTMQTISNPPAEAAFAFGELGAAIMIVITLVQNLESAFTSLLAKNDEMADKFEQFLENLKEKFPKIRINKLIISYSSKNKMGINTHFVICINTHFSIRYFLFDLCNFGV